MKTGCSKGPMVKIGMSTISIIKIIIIEILNPDGSGLSEYILFQYKCKRDIFKDIYLRMT